jgi:hypothetical protein
MVIVTLGQSRRQFAWKDHRARSGKSLEQARFSERVDRLRNDQVIEHSYIDERERLLESARDELIRGARLRETGRMIVSTTAAALCLRVDFTTSRG